MSLYTNLMKNKQNSRLSIFDTFKTKNDELTGEATRQRAIIVVLATQTNPAEKTRTGIAQRIADENGVVWKNIYSGIFRDLDEILIPFGIVEEEGRLPLKRGPKALQEKGIPYYHLTQKGMLVSLSLNEIIGREKILDEFLKNQNDELKESIGRLVKIAPGFTYNLFEKYVKAYCDGKLDEMLPFTINNLKAIADESVSIQIEMLDGFLKLSKNERDQTIGFLDKIT